MDSLKLPKLTGRAVVKARVKLLNGSGAIENGFSLRPKYEVYIQVHTGWKFVQTGSIIMEKV